VRYEDLLVDTLGVLGELATWIGLPDDESRIRDIVSRHSFSVVPERLRGSGKRRRAASPGRWRESLTDQEQELTLQIMGSQLVELGYET
jgi:hypothetical protein